MDKQQFINNTQRHSPTFMVFDEKFLKNPNTIIKYYRMHKKIQSPFENKPTNPISSLKGFVIDIIDSYMVKVAFVENSTQDDIDEFFLINDDFMFDEVTREEFIEFFKTSRTLKNEKGALRVTIRQEKDLEDDFTEHKYILHNLIFFIIDIWENVLTESQKSKSKYKEVFNGFIPVVNEFKNKIPPLEPERIQKTFQFEEKIQDILKLYKSRRSGEQL